MDDGVDAVERPADSAGVAHVTHDELDIRIEVRGPRGRAVHLLDEAVERTDAMPLRKELVGEVRADEAGAARDQDQFSQIASR
jgi:hypothetical protein